MSYAEGAVMNSEYKKLAYERAFFLAVSRVAEERFVAVEGAMDPEQRIDCDDLPRTEATVPPSVIVDGILRFQRMAAARAREMSRYRFVATTEATDEQEWTESAKEQEATGKGGGEKAGAPVRQGKSQGGKGDPQAPAGKPKPAAKTHR